MSTEANNTVAVNEPIENEFDTTDYEVELSEMSATIISDDEDCLQKVGVIRIGLLAAIDDDRFANWTEGNR